MSLLQFDPSGALHPDYGISESLWNQGLQALLPLREDLMTRREAFLRLPLEQLEAYETQRENSELGRVFAVANGMHDRLDAVVVLGAGGSSLGAQAIMQACCHPYHNELSRGARGSKPRLYFSGDHFDNDVTSALLQRLAAGSGEDNPVAARWGLCVVSKSGDRLETAVAFRQCLAALRKSLKDEFLPAYVFPITRSQGKLNDLARALGCDPIFTVPEALTGRFSVLSPVGLLPSALLGLDCMQLLVGAVAMNTHFQTAAPEDNIVLKFVATNRLLAQHRRCNVRVLSVWSNVLTMIGHWYEQLLLESFGDGGSRVLPLTMTNPRDLHARHPRRRNGCSNSVFHNLIVNDFRTDPLPVGGGSFNQDGLDVIAEECLPDLSEDAIQAATGAWRAAGHPTTQLILPTIDTFFLGQLFQMLMLATVLESRWLGQDPFGPSGSEPFLSNPTENLTEIGTN